jgi:hypothetical protein
MAPFGVIAVALLAVFPVDRIRSQARGWLRSLRGRFTKYEQPTRRYNDKSGSFQAHLTESY